MRRQPGSAGDIHAAFTFLLIYKGYVYIFIGFAGICSCNLQETMPPVQFPDARHQMPRNHVWQPANQRNAAVSGNRLN
jgi:hypothetical protein